jgi:hypothetical protein
LPDLLIDAHEKFLYHHDEPLDAMRPELAPALALNVAVGLLARQNYENVVVATTDQALADRLERGAVLDDYLQSVIEHIGDVKFMYIPFSKWPIASDDVPNMVKETLDPFVNATLAP